MVPLLNLGMSPLRPSSVLSACPCVFLRDQEQGSKVPSRAQCAPPHRRIHRHHELMCCGALSPWAWGGAALLGLDLMVLQGASNQHLLLGIQVDLLLSR